MLNYPKSRGPLSPEEREQLIIKERERAEQMVARLIEMASKYGYTQVASFEELGLTSEEKKNLMYIKSTEEQRPHRRFFSADRKDGTKVKVLAEPRANGYAADMFSPSFGESGHGGNHDFKDSDIENMLKLGLE